MVSTKWPALLVARVPGIRFFELTRQRVRIGSSTARRHLEDRFGHCLRRGLIPLQVLVHLVARRVVELVVSLLKRCEKQQVLGGFLYGKRGVRQSLP